MTKKYVKNIKRDFVFLAALFVIGLVFSFSYGAFWDQGTELKILYMNVMAYLEKFKLTDSKLWIQMVEMELTPIGLSAEMDHGVGILFPISFLFSFKEEYMWLSSAIFHCYLYVIYFLCGVISLFKLAKKVSNSSWVSYFVTLLFFFTQECLLKCITTIKI